MVRGDTKWLETHHRFLCEEQNHDKVKEVKQLQERWDVAAVSLIEFKRSSKPPGSYASRKSIAANFKQSLPQAHSIKYRL